MENVETLCDVGKALSSPVAGKEKRNISFYRRADRSAGGGEGKTLV